MRKKEETGLRQHVRKQSDDPTVPEKLGLLHFLQPKDSIKMTSGRHPARRKRPSSDSSFLSVQSSHSHRIRGAASPRCQLRRTEGPSDDPSRPAREPLSIESLSSGRYKRKRRRKTRPERYEPKETERRDRCRKHNSEQRNAKNKRKSGRRKEGTRAALARNFEATNVAKERLTLKPNENVGVFKRGRASSPKRGQGYLAFSEMRFLKKRHDSQRDEEPADGNEMRRKKDPAKADREEMSAYFLNRPPLKGKDGNLSSEAQARPRKSRGEQKGLNKPKSSPHMGRLPPPPVLSEKLYLGSVNGAIGLESSPKLTWSETNYSTGHFPSDPPVVNFEGPETPTTGERVSMDAHDSRASTFVRHAQHHELTKSDNECTQRNRRADLPSPGIQELFSTSRERSITPRPDVVPRIDVSLHHSNQANIHPPISRGQQRERCEDGILASFEMPPSGDGHFVGQPNELDGMIIVNSATDMSGERRDVPSSLDKFLENANRLLEPHTQTDYMLYEHANSNCTSGDGHSELFGPAGPQQIPVRGTYGNRPNRIVSGPGSICSKSIWEQQLERPVTEPIAGSVPVIHGDVDGLGWFETNEDSARNDDVEHGTFEEELARRLAGNLWGNEDGLDGLDLLSESEPHDEDPFTSKPREEPSTDKEKFLAGFWRPYKLY
ncbi:hypothetical protein BDY21DRAFT_180881 [Lineolata rhizophorae]|uniref:Uncharacterized protein n=1 Tax=Lineolata rhizophorae TaxID=578093 RepID=A0A6A6P7Q5_9PEZI|nr:hypothetical protein BDY21DRAFT_180881 [Lineolata rhizophorae]